MLSSEEETSDNDPDDNEDEWRSRPKPPCATSTTETDVPVTRLYHEYYDAAARRPGTAKGTTIRKQRSFTALDESAQPGRKVLIRKPMTMHTCLSTNSYTAKELTASLTAAQASVLTKKEFLRWSDNMCHYDTFLMLQLVAYCSMGSSYWMNLHGERRPVSFDEQRVVDLLCSFGKVHMTTMMQARNTIMWSVMGDEAGNSTYGQFADAMLHAYVAGCKADEYHSTKKTVLHVAETPCGVHKNVARMFLHGCVNVSLQTQLGDRTLHAHTVEDAVRQSFRVMTGEHLKCTETVPNQSANATGTTVRCRGVFTSHLESVQVGALLRIDVKLGFDKDIPAVLLVDTLAYTLVGVALWNGSHYMARFNVDGVWFDYDDIQEGQVRVCDVDRCGMPQLGRVLTWNENPKIVQWHVRGLWYTRKSHNSQPYPISIDYIRG